ncbi:MAG TPA: hypothetical protein VHC19_05530 [Pirellulales bacterium]|jgi:hypothetical protein|nr:hypothetical protein [Pirellulales bacterium]
MSRFVPLLIVLWLASAGAVGCRSCAGQLDYCGPMPDEPCDFMHRRNSILGGDKRPEAMAALAESQAEDEAEAGGENVDGENVPTPAPIPAPELEEGELGDPDAMPMSPNTGIVPQSGQYVEDDAPLSPEESMNSQYDPYAGEGIPYPPRAGGARRQTDPYAIEQMPPRGANYGPPSRMSQRPLLRRLFR